MTRSRKHKSSSVNDEMREALRKMRDMNPEERARRRAEGLNEESATIRNDPGESASTQYMKMTPDRLLFLCDNWLELDVDFCNVNFDPLTTHPPSEFVDTSEFLTHAMEDRGIDSRALCCYIEDGVDGRAAHKAVAVLERALQREISRRLRVKRSAGTLTSCEECVLHYLRNRGGKSATAGQLKSRVRNPKNGKKYSESWIKKSAAALVKKGLVYKVGGKKGYSAVLPR